MIFRAPSEASIEGMLLIEIRGVAGFGMKEEEFSVPYFLDGFPWHSLAMSPCNFVLRDRNVLLVDAMTEF